MFTHDDPNLPTRYRPLSPTELADLQAWAAGYSPAEIADVRFVSKRTVEKNLEKVATKLDLPRKELRKVAIRDGLAFDTPITLEALDERKSFRSLISSEIGTDVRDARLDEERHERLLNAIRLWGYEPHTVDGLWDGIGETSALVFDLPDGIAIQLGYLLGQDAVLSNGVLYDLRKPAPAGCIWVQRVVGITKLDRPDVEGCTIEHGEFIWKARVEEFPVLAFQPQVPTAKAS